MKYLKDAQMKSDGKDWNGAPFITVGDYTYSNGSPLILFFCGKHGLTIGKFCSIGLRLTVYLGGGHPLTRISTYPFHPDEWDGANALVELEQTGVVSKGPVVIGNDVWIGDDVTIMNNTTIGDGVVIGARSVVGSDIPPYAIAVGNPCRVVKYRFTQDMIDKLLAMKWWDWPKERINRYLLAMYRDVDLFFKAAELEDHGV